MLLLRLAWLGGSLVDILCLLYRRAPQWLALVMIEKARSKRMKEAKKEAEALSNAFRAEKEASYQASMQKVSYHSRCQYIRAAVLVLLL